MTEAINVREPRHAELAAAIGRRVENLFATRQLECAEAVLTVMNRTLGGGLSDEAAVGLASGLCDGVGGCGCACGALTGAVMSLGLFLGRRGPGIGNNRTVKSAASEIHDAFRGRFGTTCCRVLTRRSESGPEKAFRACVDRTGQTAALAAAIVLRHRPELAGGADMSVLRRSDSSVGGAIRRLRGAFSGRIG